MGEEVVLLLLVVVVGVVALGDVEGEVADWDLRRDAVVDMNWASRRLSLGCGCSSISSSSSLGDGSFRCLYCNKKMRKTEKRKRKKKTKKRYPVIAEHDGLHFLASEFREGGFGDRFAAFQLERSKGEASLCNDYHAFIDTRLRQIEHLQCLACGLQ